MISVARSDDTLVGRWWWEVDRWSLVFVLLLMGIGVIMITAGSPASAERHDLSTFHFVRRHMVFLGPAIFLLIGVSLLPRRSIVHAGFGLFAVSMLLLLLTMVAGVENNGAQRWIRIAGLTLQPSEFAKPGLAIVSAWLFARLRETGEPVWMAVNVGVLLSVTSLVYLQPDVGTTLLLSAIWGVQFFVAGLSIWLVGIGVIAGGALLVGSYYLLPHVTRRVDEFLSAEPGYQVGHAIRAFQEGGLYGVGPGNGETKHLLPDAHTDFVFAVAGEELGLAACIVILTLFVVIVLRGFTRAQANASLFSVLATAGLLTLVALQAAVNMASTLRMIPTKGMPLPFISYGGSSLVALSIAMGLVLALTRRRPEGTP